MTTSPISLTASIFMPALVEPTFTDEQSLSVDAKTSGILSKKLLSAAVILLCTSAVQPPRKSTPTSFEALSKAFASTISLPEKFCVKKLAGVMEIRLFTIGIPYLSSKSSATFTMPPAVLQM